MLNLVSLAKIPVKVIVYFSRRILTYSIFWRTIGMNSQSAIVARY
jgi:hypothetical protein